MLRTMRRAYLLANSTRFRLFSLSLLFFSKATLMNQTSPSFYSDEKGEQKKKRRIGREKTKVVSLSPSTKRLFSLLLLFDPKLKRSRLPFVEGFSFSRLRGRNRLNLRFS